MYTSTTIQAYIYYQNNLIRLLMGEKILGLLTGPSGGGKTTQLLSFDKANNIDINKVLYANVENSNATVGLYKGAEVKITGLRSFLALVASIIKYDPNDLSNQFGYFSKANVESYRKDYPEIFEAAKGKEIVFLDSITHLSWLIKDDIESSPNAPTHGLAVYGVLSNIIMKAFHKLNHYATHHVWMTGVFCNSVIVSDTNDYPDLSLPGKSTIRTCVPLYDPILYIGVSKEAKVRALISKMPIASPHWCLKDSTGTLMAEEPLNLAYVHNKILTRKRISPLKFPTSLPVVTPQTVSAEANI